MSRLTYGEIRAQLNVPGLYGKIETLKNMKKEYEAPMTPLLKLEKGREITAKKREIESTITKARDTILKIMKGKLGGEWERLNRLNTLYKEVSDRLDEFSAPDSMSEPAPPVSATGVTTTTVPASPSIDELKTMSLSVARRHVRDILKPFGITDTTSRDSLADNVVNDDRTGFNAKFLTPATAEEKNYIWEAIKILNNRKETESATAPAVSTTLASSIPTGVGTSLTSPVDLSTRGPISTGSNAGATLSTLFPAWRRVAPAAACEPTPEQRAAVRQAAEAMDQLVYAMDRAAGLATVLPAGTSTRGLVIEPRAHLRGGARKSRRHPNNRRRKTQRRK